MHMASGMDMKGGLLNLFKEGLRFIDKINLGKKFLNGFKDKNVPFLHIFCLNYNNSHFTSDM